MKRKLNSIGKQHHEVTPWESRTTGLPIRVTNIIPGSKRGWVTHAHSSLLSLRQNSTGSYRSPCPEECWKLFGQHIYLRGFCDRHRHSKHGNVCMGKNFSMPASWRSREEHSAKISARWGKIIQVGWRSYWSLRTGVLFELQIHQYLHPMCYHWALACKDAECWKCGGCGQTRRLCFGTWKLMAICSIIPDQSILVIDLFGLSWCCPC